MGKKIDQLPSYGSYDITKMGSDIFEVSKNSGTLIDPIYASDGSRNITLDELINLISLTESFLSDANNGLNVVDSVAKLGGTLLEDTLINLDNFALALTGGNLGIGVADPLYKLHVSTEDNAYNTIAARFQNSDGRKAFFVPYLDVGSYNSLSNSGDFGMFFSDNSGPNVSGDLIIAPHTVANAAGIKIRHTGEIGFGVLTPSARLHIAAGSTTVGAFKFTVSGADLLTTPEAGVIEVDGAGALYYTPDTNRETIAFLSNITDSVTDLKGGVPSGGDDLNKLYNLIVGIGQFVGAHDASGGLLPTTGSGASGAIDKGDFWRISVAGTISGLGALRAGDVIYASIDNASVAADFFAVENNEDQATSSTLGLVKLYTSTGSDTDGTMDRNSITNAISALSSVYQPLDSDLTTIAGLTATTDNFIVSVSSAWASRTPAQVRTTLGLVVGTDVQAYSSKLSAFSALANGSGVLTNDGSGNYSWAASAGTGTVTSVSVTTANGVSGSVATSTTTPAITLTLGAITPSSVAAMGTLAGSNFAESATSLRVGTSSAFGSGTTGNTIFGNNSTGGTQYNSLFGYNLKIASGASADHLFGANISNDSATNTNVIAIGNNLTISNSYKVILCTTPTTTTFNGTGYVGIGNLLSVTNATNALSGTVQIGYQSSCLDSTIQSVVIGPSAKSYVDATYGTANGENVTLGYQANSGSWKAIAIGAYAKALSVSSTAFGHTTYAIAAHCHIFGRGGYSDKGNSVLLYNAGSNTPTLYLGSIYASHTNPSIPSTETIDQSANLNAGSIIYHIKTISGVDAKPTPTLTNVRGAHIQLNGGESTGTALGGEIRLATTPVSGVSSNTINTEVVMLTLKADYTFNFTEAVNCVFGTTTGTKLGTATSQKLSFWNKTPIVQPTTGIIGATLVGGGGTAITSTDTFGGYTLQQLAAIIINTGLAA